MPQPRTAGTGLARGDPSPAAVLPERAKNKNGREPMVRCPRFRGKV